MSELKVYHCNEWHNEYTEFYLKSEADKVIAEKDEEIQALKQKLMAYGDTNAFIAKLEEQESENESLLQQNRELCQALQVMYSKEEYDKQKYKRCLAMAQEWRSYATFCGMQSSCHNHRGFGKTAEKWTWKEIHAWKCKKRWLELAEKWNLPKNSRGRSDEEIFAVVSIVFYNRSVYRSLRFA